MFLIFCVEFQQLSHLTHDLSQTEKNINVVKADQMHKMTYISLKMVKVVILSENSCHFVSCSALTTVIFFSARDKSRVKWDNNPKHTIQNRSLNQFIFSQTFDNFLGV